MTTHFVKPPATPYTTKTPINTSHFSSNFLAHLLHPTNYNRNRHKSGHFPPLPLTSFE